MKTLILAAFLSTFWQQNSFAAPETVVVIDPGHGGKDWGAVVSGRKEKHIALAVALKLKKRLENALPVYLTRESDVNVPLDERVSQSLRWGGTIFVSLHLNRVKVNHLEGIRVYAYGRETFRTPFKKRHSQISPLPDPPLENIRASASLAKNVIQSLRRQGLPVEPLAKAGFYVLKNPAIPSVLIELGYLSNPREAARLSDPAYQEKLAQALAVSLKSHALSSRLSRPLKGDTRIAER